MATALRTTSIRMFICSNLRTYTRVSIDRLALMLSVDAMTVEATVEAMLAAGEISGEYTREARVLALTVPPSVVSAAVQALEGHLVTVSELEAEAKESKDE